MLIAQGLETTWRNFAKLNTQDLTASQSQLPSSWFAESIDGAVLYDPNWVSMSASSTSFQFSSFKAPDSEHHAPVMIRWRLEPMQDRWQLWYENQLTQNSVYVTDFPESVAFYYWFEGQWLSEMSNMAGVLPEYVVIRSEQTVYYTAVTGRPAYADIPPELPVFGQYEFGS